MTLPALLFTATVTPYEVCILWSDTEVDVMFVINWLVNAVFIIDIGINFFLAYKAPLSEGAVTVKDNRRIACNYLKVLAPRCQLLSSQPLQDAAAKGAS